MNRRMNVVVWTESNLEKDVNTAQPVKTQDTGREWEEHGRETALAGGHKETRRRLRSATENRQAPGRTPSFVTPHFLFSTTS